MVEQHFCLRWNNYRTNITAEFETLREGEHFVDVTLACDGRQLKAHKVVLSACSPYFKELLQGNPCTHPIIILRDVAYTHMRSLLEFMYAGEVNISQVQLAAFLHTAEALKIRGLAESSDDRKDQGGMNSMSPLSALKNSLGGLGGLGLGSLGPSILERPLVPQLLPHHCSPDKPGGPPLPAPHHLPPHMVPPPLATLSAPLAPPSQTPGPLSTSSTSSTSSLTLATPPLPLGVVIGAGEQRTSRLDPPPDRTPSPPPPLPPSKRLRKSLAEASAPPPPPPPLDCHGDASDLPAPALSVPPLPPTTAASITVLPPEDLSHPILKTEPVESCGSDLEGGGAWCSPDDGGEVGVGCGGGGGGGGTEPTATRTPPGPTPPGGTPPPQHPAPTDNTSHLLQALSSESHLQGEDIGASGGIGGEELRHYELLPQEPRHPPPLDLRGGGEAVLIRSRVEEARVEERQAAASPPLPPSSLPHSCQLCGKLISCRRNLWKHMERVHFNNPAVRCSLCAKMFKNKYALKDHQRIYHGGLSEPPPLPPPPPQSTSLLSRILQDPRHQQHPDPRPPPPHEMQQPPMLPRDSHMRHHLEPPRRRHHEEDDVPGGGGGGYHGMGMGGMMPQAQALGPPAPLGAPRPEWPTQDNPIALVNRAALLSELHHLVTKAD